MVMPTRRLQCRRRATASRHFERLEGTRCILNTTTLTTMSGSGPTPSPRSSHGSSQNGARRVILAFVMPHMLSMISAKVAPCGDVSEA